MGKTEAKRVGVVVPTELPVLVKAWGKFQSHFPEAITWQVLSQRRPSEVIPHIAYEHSQGVELGCLVTPEMNEVLSNVRRSPEMNAINAVLHTRSMETEFKGEFPNVVKNTDWRAETKHRATLLGFQRRLTEAEARAAANKAYYEEQSAELERMYHGPNKDFYNGGGHELLVDTSHRQSAGYNGMRRWTAAVEQFSAEVAKLQDKGIEPLSLDEVNDLIADVVDRELAAFTGQEMETVGAGRLHSLGSILSRHRK